MDEPASAPDGAPRFDGETQASANTARIGRMERALISSRDGFWERNLRTNVSWYSPSFRTMLGFTPDELPDERDVVNARIHPDDLPTFLARYERAIRTVSRFDYEARFRDRNDRWRWLRGRGRAWAGADGQAELITGAISDVTAEKEALLALEEQREQLEQQVHERTASLSAALAEAELRRSEADAANEAKSRFLAHMSHEIRTPLNGILGLTELALRVTQSPAERRYLEVALQSCQTLLQVINNVLDFSRLEAGRLAINDEDFDLSDAMADAMRSVVPLVRTKGLAMLYDYVGEVTWVRGDAARVRQILTNLIGNAAKFTEHGHVQLSADVQRSGAGTCTATLRVADSGPGIDPAEIARLFDAFEQGDTGIARRHGGTGLGLSIARGLARALGGDIVADGAPGAGAAFTLRLPLHIAADPHPLAAPAPGNAWLLCQPQVEADLMRHRLARLGWTSVLLSSVPQALAQAQALTGGERPQLVMICEQVLGDADADLHALRAALPDARIALPIRVDWLEPRLERIALELGMSLVVLPLTPRDLVLLTGDRRAGAAPAAAAAAAPVQALAPLLLVEDNEVNRLIGEEFLRALGLPVRVADSGEAALAACQAEPPSLVLMDLQMPGMDGFEAARRLRALQRQGQLPPFPIVALTAHAMGSDEIAAAEAGMVGFLTKPIMLATLKTELERWLPQLRAG